MRFGHPLWYKLVGREVEPIADHDHKALAEEFAKDRHVADTIVGGAHVSTVFLSLDHNRFDDGPPILFETMVFFNDDAKKPCFDDEYMERYTTYELALQGHNAIVEKLRAAQAVNVNLTKERPDGET